MVAAGASLAAPISIGEHSACAYIPLIGAIAGILVYFGYNGLVFGGVLPVSGAAKLALVANPMDE